MALPNRIEELTRRHAKLDQEIAQEQKRPSSDDLILKTLKRQKLKLKEQIDRLRSG